MPQVAEPSGSLSVEILSERLLEDVLIRAALGSPQRAKADVCAVIDLERQGDGLLVACIACLLRARRSRTGTAGLGLVLHAMSIHLVYAHLRKCVSSVRAFYLALLCYTHLRIHALQFKL